MLLDEIERCGTAATWRRDYGLIDRLPIYQANEEFWNIAIGRDAPKDGGRPWGIAGGKGFVGIDLPADTAGRLLRVAEKAATQKDGA